MDLLKKTDSSEYFSVSVFKLAIMSICTLGLYEVYWFYRNWKHIKNRTNLEIQPIWQALLSPALAYETFRFIQNDINTRGLRRSIYPEHCAMVYLFIFSLHYFPGEYWLFSFLSFALLIPANHAITKINMSLSDSFIQNSRIKGWNWLAVLFGGPLSALTITGTFVS